MSNTFVWVDIPVRDLDRAVTFYSAVVGRAVSKVGGPGFAFGLFEHHGGEVGGCLVASAEAGAPSLAGPLVYIDASDRLDAAVAAVKAHGGKVLKDKHSIAPNGFRAIVVDSEGNRVALHSMTA
ncbi:MAG: VOC family protein [Burkholderiaceae bacterium]|jgi:predicted enzyme related to lactoylglutathione lyase